MQGYPYLSFGARPERAAPARPRSPVGHWVKLPTSWRHDATTIALAGRLAPAAGTLALALALHVRTALLAYAAADPANEDGDVARYGPAVVAHVTAWPDCPATILEDLEAAGVTRHGRLVHWAYLAHASTAAERRRQLNRQYQRDSRARRRAADMLTNADTVSTKAAPAAAAYKECARAQARGVEAEKHTQPPALRADEEPRPESCRPDAAQPSPAAAKLAELYGAPVPKAQAEELAGLVVDERDADAWQRTLDIWRRGRTADGQPWHAGPASFPRMIHRFRQLRQQDAPPAARTTPRRYEPPRAPLATPSPAGTPPPSFVPPAPRPPRSPAEMQASLESFRTAFAGTRYARLQRSEPTVRVTPARAVPDLSAIPPEQRRAVAERLLATLYRPAYASPPAT